MTDQPINIDLPYVQQVPRLQLGIEDAASALGLPVSTLELECRRGGGPKFFKVGRRLFTTVDLIREWQAKKISDLDGDGCDMSVNRASPTKRARAIERHLPAEELARLKHIERLERETLRQFIGTDA